MRSNNDVVVVVGAPWGSPGSNGQREGVGWVGGQGGQRGGISLMSHGLHTVHMLGSLPNPLELLSLEIFIFLYGSLPLAGDEMTN